MQRYYYTGALPVFLTHWPIVMQDDGVNREYDRFTVQFEGFPSSLLSINLRFQGFPVRLRRMALRFEGYPVHNGGKISRFWGYPLQQSAIAAEYLPLPPYEFIDRTR